MNTIPLLLPGATVTPTSSASGRNNIQPIPPTNLTAYESTGQLHLKNTLLGNNSPRTTETPASSVQVAPGKASMWTRMYYSTPENRLLRACERGDLSEVKKAIRQGANVNYARSTDGITPLIWASKSKNLDMVRELIGAGADVNAARMNGNRMTPLLWASYNGDLDMVRELIRAGADVNTARIGNDWSARGKFIDNVTPLMVVSYDGHLDIVRELIKAGANVNVVSTFKGSPLILAIIAKHFDIVRELIEAGAEVNHTHYVSFPKWPAEIKMGHMLNIERMKQNILRSQKKSLERTPPNTVTSGGRTRRSISRKTRNKRSKRKTKVRK